ncbi:hypothetical protein L6R52_39500 [Myxococcota bacterium]|nr:hypothetical protein [Myxococcota bacterium]
MRRLPLFAGALLLGLLAAFLATREPPPSPSDPRRDPIEPAVERDGQTRAATSTSTDPRDTELGTGTRPTPGTPRPSLARSAVIPKGTPSSGEPLVRGAWGAKPGEFGRRRDEEANPEAPMAISATGRELLVVDQMNHRVQRFDLDGKPVGTPIPISETVQDLAIDAGGRTVALDRLADKSVQLFDASGKLVNEAPIEGKGLPQGGGATGVFVDDEGIWVEREHGSVVRVADANGNADPERPELPGRPTRDGRAVVTAAVTDRAAGKLSVTAFDRTTLEPRWTQSLTLALPILQIVMLESDLGGNVFVGVHVGREGPEDPFPIIEEMITVVRIDATGNVTGSVDLAVTATGDELHRPVTVGDDGTIYQLAPGDTGLTVQRHTVR